MSRASRNRGLQQLEQELRSAEFNELLQQLQADEPFLCSFRSWGEVVSFVQNRASAEVLRDCALTAILRAHRRNQDHRWRHILFVLFWPQLEAIWAKRRRLDEQEEELWREVYWSFLKVIDRIDPAQRPLRLGRKILNDTSHQVHAFYNRKRELERRHVPADIGDIGSLFEQDLGRVAAAGVKPSELGRWDRNMLTVETAAYQRMAISGLRRHLLMGRISQSDFLLLVGTTVYGDPLADWAERLGLTYEGVKKRRQRAAAALRRAERKR